MKKLHFFKLKSPHRIRGIPGKTSSKLHTASYTVPNQTTAKYHTSPNHFTSNQASLSLRLSTFLSKCICIFSPFTPRQNQINRFEMAKMAFQHQAGTAMECLSVSRIIERNLCEMHLYLQLHPKQQTGSGQYSH